MYPVLFEIGGFRIHSYGVVVLAAVLIAIWVGAREGTRRGFGPALVERLAWPALLAGLLGGRLAYVIGWEPDLFWCDPVGVVAIWRGGLALHGALLAGFAAGLWFALRHRLPLWKLADTLAPAVILGQAVGRLACLLSGDAYGRPTSLPWAVTFTDPGALAPLGIPLHPVQLYEFALDLALFAALWSLRARPMRDGQLFLLYVLGYGAIRAVTEIFRGDRVEIGGGLSLLQGVSLALAAGALVALAWRSIERKTLA